MAWLFLHLVNLLYKSNEQENTNPQWKDLTMPRGGWIGVYKKLLQMLSSILSVTVGSPDVWVGTSDVVRSSGANISSSDAYVNYKSSAKFNFADK